MRTCPARHVQVTMPYTSPIDKQRLSAGVFSLRRCRSQLPGSRSRDNSRPLGRCGQHPARQIFLTDNQCIRMILTQPHHREWWTGNSEEQIRRGQVVVAQTRTSVHRFDPEQRSAGLLPPRAGEIPAPFDYRSGQALRAGEFCGFGPTASGVPGIPPGTAYSNSQNADSHNGVAAGDEIVQNEPNVAPPQANDGGKCAKRSRTWEDWGMWVKAVFVWAVARPGSETCKTNPILGERLTASLRTGLLCRANPICGTPESTLTAAEEMGYGNKGGLRLHENKANLWNEPSPSPSALRRPPSRGRSAIPIRARARTGACPYEMASGAGMRPGFGIRRSMEGGDGYNPGEEFLASRAHLGRGGTHIYER
jgi:hypothetical protein